MRQLETPDVIEVVDLENTKIKEAQPSVVLAPHIYYIVKECTPAWGCLG